jgi:dynein heavy chain
LVHLRFTHLEHGDLAAKHQTDAVTTSQDALRSLSDMCHSRVEALLLVVRSSLAPADGRKAVSLLTEEIHMRDVIARLVDGGVTSTLDFLWQSQLRLVFQVGQSESSVSQHSDLSPEASVVSDVASSITSAAPCNVTIRICNYSTGYGFEYLGSCCRLVITPLTERCYVSLTNALFLNVGGALVGPPGTGKTETIKDLARAMGLPCYVLNCSGGMSISVLGQILRGLVQSGAWGCFDEFHQLSADIISPLICQIESIQAAQARLSFSIADDVTPPDGATFSEWKIGLFDFMGGQVRKSYC